MFRLIALLFIILSTGHAHADDACPEFYRFVDFGKKAQDGELYRGGPTFRGEGLDRSTLLLTDQSTCRDIREVSRDGRGYAIPIVTHIAYDPARTGLPLTTLTISSVEDSAAKAEENARAHRARLSQSDATVTRGADFLCVRDGERAAISCQIVSPYPGNIALVVYCDEGRCEMPVMAMDDRLIVGSAWDAPDDVRDHPKDFGAAIVKRAQDIRELLETLS